MQMSLFAKKTPTVATWPLMRAKVSDDQRWCPDGTVRVIVVAAGVYCEEQPGPVRYDEGCIVHVRRDVVGKYTTQEA